MTNLKICCIASVAEMQMAVSAGAGAIGLVSRMPSGPGPIPDALIREIAAAVPAGIDSFLLTSLVEPDAIAAQVREAGTTAVQLVDALPSGGLGRLRQALPATKIVQVIHVVGPESVAEARSLAPLVDLLLLDSGNPSAAVKELGGTGRTHDWALSREIAESVRVPVYLAGGLHPLNVAEAVRQVRPFGVDVCSRLRTAGALDPAKVRAFVEALWPIGV